MPTTIRELCLAALFARLEAIAGIADLKVERNRDAEVSEFPTLVQMDGGHRPRGETTGSEERTLAVTLEGYLQGASPEDLTARVDALYAAAADAVFADPTLGGTAVDTRETGFDIEFAREVENPTAAFALQLEIDFEHAWGRLTAAV